ncbi:transglutaminaseTgpA domain-containing protein [Halostella pelagica]|uniref:transglutaminaseTgpA domain-containing protein n=1 Tax=Halostella pelagica TaxID=2583824 RepID=UPI001081BA18|nr:transglutaminaseTgpA domain-containing protein [Halostella pelagica]
MAGSRSPDDDRQDASNSPSASGRDLSRAVLAVCCAIGLVIAGTVMPALAAPLSGGSIDKTLFDQPGSGSTDPGGTASGSGPAASSGLGALNPGDSTGVGGSLGDQSGALRNQSAETHFYVESDEPAYWRTGAYAEYEGSGWQNLGTASDVTGQRPPGDGQLVEQQIELERPASTLPAAYRPVDVDADTGVFERRGALIPEQSVPDGTEYTVMSYRVDPDPATLRRAETEFPGDERTYTQLPATTPDRVEEFTSELTANDRTDYDSAKTIQKWLKENHDYSLDASHESGEPVADQFIFEMDEGYCEYFATTMAVMLRSQDIPARYVVGYSQGQPTDDGRYQVRGMNAHAWVEVYFEDVGWVKFDPTPAADRQTTQQQAIENQTGNGEEYPHDVETGPNETYEPSDESISNAGPPYNIDLDRTPAPGRDVTVTVEKGGTPVEGVVVSFNDDEIGVTDSSGEVTGTVPYEGELEVSVRPRGDGYAFAAGPSAGPGKSSEPTTVGNWVPTTSTAQEENGSRTYDVDTAVDFEVRGTATPGATVDLYVRAGGEPMRNATVRVDGRAVGETDVGGIAAVAIPEDAGGRITVAAERGTVSGETEIELGELSVSVDGLAVAGRNATATVTVDDQPVSNATVYVDGDAVGTTDANGELSVSLPLSNGATLTASVDGRRTETALDWLFLPIAVGVAILLGTLAGVVAYARRRDVTADDVRNGLRWLAGAGLAVIVALSDGLDGVARLARRAADRLDWIPDRLRALVAGMTAVSVVAAAVALLRRLCRPILRLFGVADERAAASAGDGADRNVISATPDENVTEAQRSLRAVWREFVRIVSPRGWRTQTPGDIARSAVKRGFPDGPVYRLTNAFRRSEYADDPPDEGRLSAARRALDRLRDRTEDR